MNLYVCTHTVCGSPVPSCQRRTANAPREMSFQQHATQLTADHFSIQPPLRGRNTCGVLHVPVYTNYIYQYIQIIYIHGDWPRATEPRSGARGSRTHTHASERATEGGRHTLLQLLLPFTPLILFGPNPLSDLASEPHFGSMIPMLI